jgi:hypothetical protein
MNETIMGIRPSSSSERKIPILDRNLEIKLQTLKYVASNTDTAVK